MLSCMAQITDAPDEQPSGDVEVPRTERRSWPRLPNPPRELAPKRELIELASDGHRQRVWAFAGFFVGPFVLVQIALRIDVLMQSDVAVLVIGFSAMLLSPVIGWQTCKWLLRGVLRDGVQIEGEVTQVDRNGDKATIAYRYVVDSRESKHNMWARDPQVIAQTKVGTPMLVLYDRGRIDRHLAYLPAQFGRLRELLPTLEFDGDAPELGTPYREQPDAPKTDAIGPLAFGAGLLPAPPRPLPLETARALRIGVSPRQNTIVIAAALITMFSYMPMVADLIEPTMWLVVPLFVTAGLAVAFTFSPPFTGRWLLCNGVEAGGVVEGTSVEKAGTRISYSFEVGGHRHRHAMYERDAQRAEQVAVGDAVLVLYARGAPWFSMAFIEPEARALVAECRKR